MSSKRNKLLVFLGLVTVVVSKSHNQRFLFEHGFESQRTSASKPSANTRHSEYKSSNLMPSGKVFPPTPTGTYRGYLSQFDDQYDIQLQPDHLTSSVETDQSLYVPRQRKTSSFRLDGLEDLQTDSTDTSFQIDSEEYRFEPKKLNRGRNRKKTWRNTEKYHDGFFSRRSGEIATDEYSQTNENTSLKTEKESNKDSAAKLITQLNKEVGKTTGNENQKSNDNKRSRKKIKGRRKKVIRVRPNQAKNKTKENDEKINQTPLHKQKLLIIDTTANDSKSKTANAAKLREIKQGVSGLTPWKESQFKAPSAVLPIDDFQPNKSKKVTEIKEQTDRKGTKYNRPDAVFQKDDFNPNKIKVKDVRGETDKKEIKFKAPDATLQKDIKPNKSKKEMAVKPQKNSETESYDGGDKDQILTFFRRTGEKIVSVHPGVLDYPKPEWMSMYKTENHNKDDNYYVLSFNYMGNKNQLRAKYEAKAAPDTASRKRTQHKEGERQKPEYPTAELNIDHLGKTAESYLDNRKKTAAYEDRDKAHYDPSEENIPAYSDDKTRPKSGNNDHFREYIDDWLDNQSHVEKQLTPTVTLKRKKPKKNKDAVWKLQAPKKKLPEDDREFPNYGNTDAVSGGDVEDPTKDAKNYFVRSFIKLPSGENVDLNLKDGQLTRGKDDAEVDSPVRKPLQAAENAGDGTYFMRMYKTVGDVENFDIQSGENGKFGYQSNLKLSWDKDDTRARVDDTTDSLAPKGRASSLEDSGSHDDIYPQSSESIMQYKSDYVDDSRSTLHGDRSYYADRAPFFSRHRRSAEQTPRVTSHFKIGDSNYTVEYTPTAKFHSKRFRTAKHEEGTDVHPAPQTKARDSGGQSTVASGNEKHSDIKSYYHKPAGTQLENEFRVIKDVLDKPAITTRNVQTFRAYQTPNRRSPKPHIAFSHNGNGNGDTKLVGSGGIGQERTSQPMFNQKHVGTASTFNNFRTMSNATVIQSSTDIKSIYVKPDENMHTSENANKTTQNFTLTTSPIPVVKESQLKTTKKPTEPQKYTQFFHKRVEHEKEQILSNVTVGHAVREQNSSSVTSSQEVREETTPKPTTESHSTAILFPPKTRPNISDRPTVKPIVQQTTATVKAATQGRIDETPLQSTTELYSTVTFYSPRTRTYKPNRSTIKSPLQRTVNRVKTTFIPVIQDRMDETTIKSTTAQQSILTSFSSNSGPSEPSAQFSTKQETYQTTPESRTIHGRIDKTTSFPKTVRNSQFFHQSFKTNNQEQGARTLPSIQSRHMEDWRYAPDDMEDYNSREVQQEIKNDLQTNGLRTKHSHFDSEDSSRDYNSNAKDHSTVSKVVTPKVPFYWDHQKELPTKQNYPMYHSIPKTEFTCRERPPGYYADPDTSCQVFHMCHSAGAKHSFLCPNTTIFNQELLVCDWYSKVNCGKSESFYGINNNIYHGPSEGERKPKQQITKYRNYHQQKPKTEKYSEQKDDQHRTPEQPVKHYEEKELTYIPKFIVDRLKDKVPNAEIGRPKSVSKSYRTVISKPTSTVSFPTQSYRTASQSEKQGISDIHEKGLRNTEETLIPDAFLEKQKAIKDSWTFQDVERALNHQLQAAPETVQQDNKYDYHPHSNPKYTYTDHGNSKLRDYAYLTASNPGYKPLPDNDAHVASRQKEKLIVVNRNRLRPDYESAESPELETTIKEESLSKVEFPDARLKSESGYYRHNDQSDKTAHVFHYNSYPAQTQNTGHKKSEYTHPLTGMLQNGEKSKDVRFILTEDSKLVSPQTSVFKLGRPQTSPNHPVKHGAENDAQKNKVKLRIKEIKSGVESIGTQLGKILGDTGTDAQFKNIRIYKLKPYGSHEEFQEIKLPPFKFERHSKRPHITVEKQLYKPVYINEENFQSTPKLGHVEYVPKTENQLPNMDSKGPFVATSRNAEQLRDDDPEKTLIAIPKIVQQVVKNIAPKYYDYHKPPQPKYQRINYGEVRAYDHMVKPKARNTISGSTTDRNPLKELNPNTKLPRTGTNLFQNGTDIGSHPTSFVRHVFDADDKEYEIKYIPLIRVNKPTKDNSNRKELHKHSIKKRLPGQVPEKPSEYFKHIAIPKRFSEGRSIVEFPDKINIQQDIKAGKNQMSTATSEIQPKLKERNKIDFDNAENIEVGLGDKVASKPLTPRPNIYPHPTVKIFKPLNHKKDIRTFVIISKSALGRGKYSNFPINDQGERLAINDKNSDTFHRNVDLSKQPRDECEDSSDEPSFTLGKNGPVYNSVKSIHSKDKSEEITIDFRSYYNPKEESTPKCRNHSSKSENDFKIDPQFEEQPNDHDKSMNFERKHVSKVPTKDLKRPITPHNSIKNAFTKPVITPRPELLRAYEKPVKLFDFQRSSRPAFIKPSTTKPILNIPGIHKKLSGYDQYPTKVEHDASDSSKDISEKRSEKEGPNGRHSRYADLERAAELKAKQATSNGQVKFSAARKSPQGRITPEDSSERSISHSRHSRYATLEREAERMIQMKSYSP